MLPRVWQYLKCLVFYDICRSEVGVWQPSAGIPCHCYLRALLLLSYLFSGVSSRDIWYVCALWDIAAFLSLAFQFLLLCSPDQRSYFLWWPVHQGDCLGLSAFLFECPYHYHSTLIFNVSFLALLFVFAFYQHFTWKLLVYWSHWWFLPDWFWY